MTKEFNKDGWCETHRAKVKKIPKVKKAIAENRELMDKLTQKTPRQELSLKAQLARQRRKCKELKADLEQEQNYRREIALSTGKDVMRLQEQLTEAQAMCEWLASYIAWTNGNEKDYSGHPQSDNKKDIQSWLKASEEAVKAKKEKE